MGPTLVVLSTNTGTGIINFGSTTGTSGAAGTSGTLAYAGTIYLEGNSQINFNNTDTATLAATVVNDYPGMTLALSKVGTGTAILTGNNTFSGTTTISAGVLQLGNGGTTGSVATAITDNAQLTLDRSNTGLVLAGAISGTGSVVQIGSGTSTLSGTNTYSGVTTVSAGTLQAGSTSALSSSSDFTVTSILNLGGFTNAIGSLAGSGTVTDTGAAATLSSGGDNATTTFSGVLQNGTGVLALTKSGTGTLTLTGTNTYTGGTAISAGTLQLGNAGTTGSITGAITDNGVLQFNRTDTALSLTGNITGTGSVIQAGTGSSTLSGTNTL